jgi:hypothetical protein
MSRQISPPTSALTLFVRISLFFRPERAIMKPQAVEFLVHMSLATVAAAVNSLAEEVVLDEVTNLMVEESVGEHGPSGSVSVLKFRPSGVTFDP